MTYYERFSKETVGPQGIRMTRIGGWSDLTAYYAGSDGNAWSYWHVWTNHGELVAFKLALMMGKYRGELEPI